MAAMAEKSVEVWEQSSWEKHFVNATKAKFGQDIEIRDFNSVCEQLEKFVKHLLFTVVSSSPEPVVKTPREIDTTEKEFCNLGDTDKHETVKLENGSGTISRTYHFLVAEGGISFDDKYSLGALLADVAVPGAERRVGDRAFSQDLLVHHKEAQHDLVIPPKHKIVFTTKTYIKEYEQKYSLKFKIQRSEHISVTYLTKSQQRLKFFGLSSKGDMFADEILQTLPNFEVDDAGYCYFTLDGTLTRSDEERLVNISQSSI